jgi:phage terminase large subunit
MHAVCIREVQKSLAQSSKRTIEMKIQAFGLGSMFNILKTEIETPGGGLIIFQGMQNHTQESIKSLEGYEVAWVDEAQSLSQSSLDLLYPTIRKPGSELWFSWNPRKADDPVDVFFRKENIGEPGFACIQANFNDNPWFSETEMYRDMLRDRRRDADRYAHIWLGDYLRNSEAQVFRNWKIDEFETPADARFYFGADWGFSVDPTVLVRCFIQGRTLFVDHEAYKVGCDIDHTPALFAGIDTHNPPRWTNPRGFAGIPGATHWPIKADSSNPQSISYLRGRGFQNITAAVKGPGSVEEGVEFLKGYDIVVHPRCKHVIDELTLYSYEVDKQTGDVLPKLADKKNHTIDSLRYAVEGVRRAPVPAAMGTYSRSGAR